METGKPFFLYIFLLMVLIYYNPTMLKFIVVSALMNYIKLFSTSGFTMCLEALQVVLGSQT